MKKARHTPSPALTEVNQYLDERSERFMKAMDKAWANRRPFPYGHRGPVYIWLWENRAAVTHAMEVHWLSWDTLALAAADDGIVGRWGKPPTGNAMRRVWVRVCQELEKREARKRVEAVNGPRRS